MSMLFPLLALAVTSSNPSAPIVPDAPMAASAPSAPSDWSPLFAGPEAPAASPTFASLAYRPIAPVPSDDTPEMEYTYIELNYLWTDSHDLDDSIDGAELTGSLELPLNFFGQLTVTRQSAGGTDVDTYRLGAGYHLPLGSRIDAYGILSYVHAEVDVGENIKDDGAAAELGLRFLLLPNLEVNGAAKWIDVNEDDYGVALGARWYLMDRLSFGGRYETIDNDDTVALGARFEF